MDIAIKNSVGAGGTNDRLDVSAVQIGLNMIYYAWEGPETDLDVTGFPSGHTINAIRRFQRHSFGKVGKADGKIEPGDRTLKKINQVLAGGVDLVMLGPPRKKEDNGILAAAAVWGSEIRFSGLTNMVDLIERALRNREEKIKSLIIISHGVPGVMRTSRNKEEEMEDLTLSQLVYPNYKDYPPDELAFFAADTLSRLKGKFAPQALVTLYACRIAAATTYGKKPEYGQPFGNKDALHAVDGRNLLKGVSKVLGNVAVQGSGDPLIRERPTLDGMEGQPIYRCDGHVCAPITNIYESYWGPEYEEHDAFWDHAQEDLRAEMAKVVAEKDPGKKKGILRKLKQRFRKQ